MQKLLRITAFLVLLFVILLFFVEISPKPVESLVISDIFEEFSIFLPGNAIPYNWNCYSYYDSNYRTHCVKDFETLTIYIYGFNNKINYTHFYFTESVSLAEFVRAYGRWENHKSYARFSYWYWKELYIYTSSKTDRTSLFTPIRNMVINL